MEGADATSAAIEDGLLGFFFPFRVSLATFLSCCYRRAGALILISNSLGLRALVRLLGCWALSAS